MQESRFSRAALAACAVVLGVAGCGGGGGGGGGGGSSLAPIQTGTNPPGTNPPGTNPPGTNPPGTPGNPPAPLALPSGPVGGKRVEGIDVSYHNGTIDWKKVQAAGIGFAFIRVSDGLNLNDPQFATNWAGAKQNDIVRGVYQYFRGSQSGVSQANLLISKIGTQGATDLQPVCDIEELDGVSASTLVSRARDWMNTIQSKTGLTPIIYTSPAFWNSLNASFGDNDLWIAHWNVTAPQVPNGWDAWNFWQYTDSGTVSGITGNVDRNVFNGTLADLRAFAGYKPAAGFFRALAVNSTGKGGWLVSTDGGVFQKGDATFRGTAGGKNYPQPYLGIARSSTGLGYRLVRADGIVTVFGDATHVGDMTGKAISAPIVAIAGTPTNKGYWLLGRDGTVKAFGDAQSYGQPTLTNTVAVGIAPTPTGNGYFVACADGSVHAFGGASSQGDLKGQALTAPIVGIAATATGNGYWLALSDGTVGNFGDAQAHTYKGTAQVNGTIVGITATLTGQGFWLVGDDGNTLEHGDATALPYRTR